MTNTSKTIVFFGSGPVAAKSLSLLAQDFTIEAIVTKPSTEAEMQQVADGAPVLTVNTKQALDELIATNPFESRLAILIDFGIIVSQKVIDYFPLGIINSHFSLLPEWRGADPITFAILSGQQQTGVSLMLLVEKMDEGPLLAQTPYDIPGDCTTPQLTDSLIELSYESLKSIVPLYLDGQAEPVPQPEATATYSRKLTKDDGLLDFSKPAKQLEREIRAYLDWPKSRTTIAGKEVVALKAGVRAGTSKPQGVPFATEDKKIAIPTSEEWLIIEELKPAGKNAMSAEAFCNGYKPS
jgi:methionyl-tRNA formyltransferase